MGIVSLNVRKSLFDGVSSTAPPHLAKQKHKKKVEWISGDEGRGGGGIVRDGRAKKPEAKRTVETVSVF